MVDDSIIIWIIGIRELYWDYMVVIWFLWWFYVDYTTNNTNWLMMSLRVTLQPILIVLNYHGILCSKNYGYFTVCIWVISCDFQISHHNWPIMWISWDIMGMKHQQGLTYSHSIWVCPKMRKAPMCGQSYRENDRKPSNLRGAFFSCPFQPEWYHGLCRGKSGQYINLNYAKCGFSGLKFSAAWQ